MEYFVGAVLTLLVVVVTNKLIISQLKEEKKVVVKYSQSYIYSIIAPMMFGLNNRSTRKQSQSFKYQEDSYIRVVVVENKAYWIRNNTFYTAEVMDGTVDKDSTKEVDTMAMGDVELKKMLMIVETLREGSSGDSSGTGKS
jgi:ferric iron reductase protein FhuF